jgi:hypothetical protein
VGKRACLWIQELVMDEANLAEARAALKFRGVKVYTSGMCKYMYINGVLPKPQGAETFGWSQRQSRNKFPLRILALSPVQIKKESHTSTVIYYESII